MPSGEDASFGAVVAPPHPLYGGSMDSPVVTEIAHACANTQTASLRFNWRGVGGSAGQMSGEPDVGLADYYGGPTQVLEIVGDEVRVLE